MLRLNSAVWLDTGFGRRTRLSPAGRPAGPMYNALIANSYPSVDLPTNHFSNQHWPIVFVIIDEANPDREYKSRNQEMQKKIPK